MICLEEAQQRQPEREYRPLYSALSRVEPLGRVGQVTENGRYWLRVQSRFVVVRIEDTKDERFIVINTHTGEQIKMSPAKFKKNARNLGRCPKCHVLHFAMPRVGRECLACQTRLETAKAKGESCTS